MPFYEYQCRRCGRRTVVRQSMTAAPATVCPACGQPALARCFTTGGVLSVRPARRAAPACPGCAGCPCGGRECEA